MKKDELKKSREKNLKELKDRISQLQKEIAQKKLERAAGKLKNTGEIAKLKRDLAQTLTIFVMKELMGQQAYDGEKQTKEANI